MIKTTCLPEVTRGDPVQVRFTTHDGYLWNDATVHWVDPSGNGLIHVVYADFRREVVERDRWRHAEWDDKKTASLPIYQG